MNNFFRRQWKLVVTIVVCIAVLGCGWAYGSSRISDLNGSVHTLEATVSQANASLEEENGKNTDLQKQLDTANSTIDKDKSTISEQNSKITTIQKKLDSLANYDKQINDLKNKNNQLKKANDTLKSDNGTLKSKNKSLESDNSSLKSKNSSLESDNSSLKSKNSSLKQQIDSKSSSTSSYDEPEEQTSSYTVYITDTGKKYHRAGCRYLSHSKHEISLEDAIAQGYTACSVCNP